MDFTKRSAKAFRFGLRGGSRTGLTESGSTKSKGLQLPLPLVAPCGAAAPRAVSLRSAAIAIVDDVPGMLEFAFPTGDIAGHLLHELRVGRWRDTTENDAPGAQVDEKEDVAGHESSPAGDFHGEEVGCPHDIPVPVDELLPGPLALPLGSRFQTVSLQDVAHRLIRHIMSQVREGTDNPVVAPTAVLPGEAKDELADVRRDLRSALLARGPTRGIELADHQPPIPAHKRVRLDDANHMSVTGCDHGPSTRSQFPTLLITEQQPFAAVLFVLLSQHARFGHQIVDDLKQHALNIAPNKPEHQSHQQGGLHGSPTARAGTIPGEPSMRKAGS